MEIVDRAGAPAARLEELARALSGLGTLEGVLRWLRGLPTPTGVAGVVTQDEYTHDVVVDWGGGLFLVFDTT